MHGVFEGEELGLQLLDDYDCHILDMEPLGFSTPSVRPFHLCSVSGVQLWQVWTEY